MASCDGETSWRGVPLTDIYGSQSPWGAPEFQLVVPASNHAVLYHIPSNGRPDEDVPPKPRIGSDVWSHDFVRMPCSSQSLYPVEDRNGETHLKKRWEIIECALSKPIRNCRELADAILSYNTKFKSVWKFRALFKLFDDYLEEEETEYFFNVTLPEMMKLALALPKLVQAPIPLLMQHKNKSISLSQQQIASLLANAFFCTFPRRNTTKRQSEYASYPFINFNRLFNSSTSDCVMEKLKCICHYFRRVCTKVPGGVVTFSRRSVPAAALPRWPLDRTPVGSLPLHVDSQTKIEDASGLIQVDFANKFLGGGVLNTGCVQEEIRFVICPELMLSMLFTEMLKPNEALMIIGCERYSSYCGYGRSFQWAGDYSDASPRDSCGRRRVCVLALDALPAAGLLHEHEPPNIARDLNKAWVGISFFSEGGCSPQRPGLGTGNWGCGAFGGSPRLKALLQLLACARVRRPMAYFTFGDTQLRDDLVDVYNMLARHNVTVGELYKYIMKFTTTDVRCNQLYLYLRQVLQDRQAPPNAHTLMDTSEVAETTEAELSGSVLQEFLNESPDLFTPEECEQSATEVKIDIPESMDAADEDNVTSTPQKDHSAAREHTARFLEDMQRLDEESGKLNLSTPNKPPFTHSTQLPSKEECKDTSNAGITEKTQGDISPEKKKKMTSKITDYFSKKPI